MSNFGFDSELKFVSDHLSCLQPSSIRGLVASWTSLLRFLLSLVFFNRSSNGIPVHSSMLSIHRILGLPCFLARGVVPCMMFFSRQSPSFLIRCPKYDNFLLLIMLSSSRSIPAVSNTHSFVFFCVHNTLRIRRMYFIPEAFQLSTPIYSHRHTRAFISLTLVVNFMLRLFQICFIPGTAHCPLASFPLISLLHSASSVIVDPRY